MLAVLFFILLVLSAVTWGMGLPSWVVFPIAVATWVAFYFLAYPRIRTYKVAMGVDDELNSLESKGFNWLVLHLKGLKVIALGFLTSMLPFASNFFSWLSSQNLGVFFGPEDTAKVTFWVGLAVFALPMLGSWLHVGAVSEAAITEPKA